MARKMVTQWGMSDALGTMVYGEKRARFLGRSVTHNKTSLNDHAEGGCRDTPYLDEQYALARS